MNDSQSIPETTASDPAMERMSINNRELAFYRTGSGSPVVVLETGLGAESSEWTSIQRSIGAVTLTFRYDRVGRGASHPADSPRSAGEMVNDLHTLLSTARIPSPYILVGHSFGGLLMRLFAHRYPAEVGGLLLVDAMNEDQFDVISSVLPPARDEDPEPLRNFRDFWTGGWRDPKSTQERIDFAASFREVQEIRSLGQLPVHVITAGTGITSPFMPESLRPRMQSLWDGLQRRFLELSPLATQSFVLTSGHFVQRDAPEVVVEAIKGLIDRVRETL
jgi:pimeloyl-ACP methyl ester carboxylesterase